MKFLLAVQTPLDVQEPSTSLHTKVNHSATNISNYEWGTIECTKVYVNNRSGWSDLYLSKHFFTKKKKKKKNSRTRRCQSCIGTHIKEDKGWKMSSHLWCLLHNDCKFVIYFIFLQRIGDYIFFFVKRSLDCEAERCLYVWMIIFICEADIFIAITIKIW